MLEKSNIRFRKLPYAVNCAEYEEQNFGTVKTPKNPEAMSTTMYVSVIKLVRGHIQ